MRYGISFLGAIPGRSQPSDASEMVTQILFGQIFWVLEVRKKWIRIRNASDRYEAWIDNKQWLEIEKKEFDYLLKHPGPLCSDLIGLVKWENEQLQSVPLSSNLPRLSENKGKLGDRWFEFLGSVNSKGKPREKIIANAKMLLNTPYLWGGKIPFGMDCSGFTQVVYAMAGIAIPRDASQQADIGQSLSFIEETTPGDLCFFHKDDTITHVGIILEDNHIIHAHGHIRIDRIDHQGIFNKDLRDYTHYLRLMKKIT